MALTLHEKQIIFSRCLYQLLFYSYTTDIQLGELWRSPETCALYAKEGKGIQNSCHQLRLAIDLNIFVNGALSNNKADYESMGRYWKSLSTSEYECAWGGDFKSRDDFFHFSIEHNGVR